MTSVYSPDPQTRASICWSRSVYIWNLLIVISPARYRASKRGGGKYIYRERARTPERAKARERKRAMNKRKRKKREIERERERTRDRERARET